VFVWAPFHYIHMMFITLLICIFVALFINRFIFKNHAELVFNEQK